jgi:hypothetical protein
MKTFVAVAIALASVATAQLENIPSCAVRLSGTQCTISGD